MDTAVEIRGLKVRYGSVTALDGVGMSVLAGDVVALVGPNGAGKTSLLRAVCGLVVPASGTIVLGGEGPASRWKLAARTAYVPTEPRFPRRLSIASWLALRASLLEMEGRLHRDLRREVERFIGPLKGRRVEELSRGQRLQLALVTELSGEPPLIAADEPWSGLDPVAREMVLARLVDEARRGAAVLISSHDLQGLAEIAARFAFLHRGTIRARCERDGVQERALHEGTTADRVLLEMYKEITRGGEEGPCV